MMSAGQYKLLYDILAGDSTKFESSLRRFQEVFSKEEYFRVGWVVQHMIQHNVSTNAKF